MTSRKKGENRTTTANSILNWLLILWSKDEHCYLDTLSTQWHRCDGLAKGRANWSSAQGKYSGLQPQKNADWSRRKLHRSRGGKSGKVADESCAAAELLHKIRTIYVRAQGTPVRAMQYSRQRRFETSKRQKLHASFSERSNHFLTQH